MQVVPQSVGELLDALVQARGAAGLGALPARVERGSLRHHARPAERARVAALSARVAAFADGMRAMEKCACFGCVFVSCGRRQRSAGLQGKCMPQVPSCFRK